jgi:acyl-CoA synthetase (AMP-forming)/AMP-acid ligase II
LFSVNVTFFYVFCWSILQHPAIAECVVMGTPDKDYGEIVVAIIVPCKEQIAGSAAVHEPVLTLKALQRWAHNLLAPYKVNCSTLYFLVLEFFHSFSIGQAVYL